MHLGDTKSQSLQWYNSAAGGQQEGYKQKAGHMGKAVVHVWL